MFEFKLPDVGEGMHEAEILRWLIAPGDRVKVDQPMLEIQTDKAVVEIPAPVAGIVADIPAPVGQIAHVGDVLVRFDTETARPASSVTKPEAASAVANAPVATVTSSENGLTTPKPGAVRAAPAVRKRAVELDIDLNQVRPSSPDGRILLTDLEAFVAARTSSGTKDTGSNGATKSNGYASTGNKSNTNSTHSLADHGEVGALIESVSPAPTPASIITNSNGTTGSSMGGEERKALAGLRRRIAERMELSWRTIPHAASFTEVDATELVALRSKLQASLEKSGLKMTYLPLVVKAVVQVLKQHPIFNASLDDQTREIIYKSYYHIGLATATPDGLLVPVVREADKRSLLDLANEVNRLGDGGRKRTLKPNELSGSTFTISNVGSFGGSYGVAVINPPEAAILAVGKASEQAVVRDGQVVIRNMLPLSLSFDHRLIDGAQAGAFLNSLKELLVNPSLLLLEAI